MATMSKRPPEQPVAAPCWAQGWYRFARRLDSPNFGPRPAGVEVDLIVLHSISLPPGRYGGGEVQRLFTNQLDWNAHPYFKSIEGAQVSAHFFISRRGELWQFVSVFDRAWHAGASAYLGRGNCNDFSVGIELEGLEGGLFEAPQYETLGALCSSLLLHLPVRGIAGHEHIAPGRKHDPGAGFDWPAFRRGLSAPAGTLALP
jgi:N-acetyl-anhydromuramoyl-L-alanine amidase